jgi:Caspase domain
LTGVVGTRALLDGMYATATRTQLYFFDCCRDSLVNREQGLALEKLLPRLLPSPLASSPPPDIAAFFATSSGNKAYARNGQTVFSQALLECLNGDAAIRKEETCGVRASVTVGSLARALFKKVPDLFREPPGSVRNRQVPEVLASLSDWTICFVDAQGFTQPEV